MCAHHAAERLVRGSVRVLPATTYARRMERPRQERVETSAKSRRADGLENLRVIRERSGPSEVERPFRSLDLVEMNLAALDLSGADLSRASLAATDLEMVEAFLESAVPIGADLTDARLVNADVDGADLRRALLANANLSDAFLGGAGVTDAVLDAAVLTGRSSTVRCRQGRTRLRRHLACRSHRRDREGLRLGRCDRRLGHEVAAGLRVPSTCQRGRRGIMTGRDPGTARCRAARRSTPRHGVTRDRHDEVSP